MRKRRCGSRLVRHELPQMIAERKTLGPGLTLVRQVEAIGGSAPAMQKGISVELPVTNNAVPVRIKKIRKLWLSPMTADCTPE